jgi:hypothetical protein
MRCYRPATCRRRAARRAAAQHRLAHVGIALGFVEIATDDVTTITDPHLLGFEFGVRALRPGDVETRFALYLVNHFFNDPSAKTLPRRRLYRRATHLRPADDQAAVCLVQPCQVNLALGCGQSPILGGIGR